MKYCFFILLFNFQSLFAQTFPVDTLKFSGDSDKRINFVILSEGYQTSELDTFIIDATNFMNAMFSQSPFKEYADYFNVYAIKVPSNESGADHPGTGSTYHETNWPVPTTDVDTFFNATFDSYGNHFLLFYEIDGNYANNTELKINSVLADNFPNYDQTLILVNSPYYGGSGGQFPMASTGASSSEIAIHEIGHSLFDLKDEYYPGDLLASEAINMTQETNTSVVKWKNWMGINGIGIFPYGITGTASTWYKPRHQECKMEVLNKPFCSVCKEGMIEKFHDLVTPIDTYSPTSNTIDNPSFPIDFELTLVKPIPNTLESSWSLNASNFANNMDTVSISETNLNTGTNTLIAVVNDATTLLKVDNHETLHVYTITWTINKAALGIDDITSETNNFEIKVFPNPSNDIVNFKFESTLNTNLKLDIVSLDGKKIQSYTLTNSETYQIDISNLSQGIYLAKFYTNNVLLASKKLVKK